MQNAIPVGRDIYEGLHEGHRGSTSQRHPPCSSSRMSVVDAGEHDANLFNSKLVTKCKVQRACLPVKQDLARQPALNNPCGRVFVQALSTGAINRKVIRATHGIGYRKTKPKGMRRLAA